MPAPNEAFEDIYRNAGSLWQPLSFVVCRFTHWTFNEKVFLWKRNLKANGCEATLSVCRCY